MANANNIYTKLQTMRVALQGMNIKKTGENKFAGYKYYELGDILPPINQLLLENKAASFITFTAEEARLTIINCEDPQEQIVFTSPMQDAVLKGAHPIQNLGAVETYQRRYLYMAAFEIVEADVLDYTQGKDNVPPAKTPAKAPTAKGKAKLLSEETSNKLNAAIAEYRKTTGVPMDALTKSLSLEIGKNLKMADENDAKVILVALSNWTEKYYENLVV